ncbi:unnamed protein product [Hermetia illucens]|uniref:Homeobox domain-containing protein n=1 Tax=Hermetia illucens TaxID=343691 RepID=A0A7R8UNT1_HERIL|nr:brain-specific homeobox protein homolog [Hermetia illucens]CAD7084258.1 unnamed protein product [Hermetia illucens]
MNPRTQRKSGFNIDDILEQQEHNETWRQCEGSQKPVIPSVPIESGFQEYTDPATVRRWSYLHMRPENVSYDALYSANLPLYQHMIELQKTSQIVPFPFGMGNPATYLEQYGSVLDKGFPTIPAFYAHSYPAYYIPPGGSKRKGGQIRFTPQQTRSLESRFASAKYLSPEDRRHLAIQLKLSDRQVKTWFQNRRAKYRRSNSSISGSNLQESSAESAGDKKVTGETPMSTIPRRESDLTTDDESSSDERFDSKDTEKHRISSTSS